MPRDICKEGTVEVNHATYLRKLDIVGLCLAELSRYNIKENVGTNAHVKYQHVVQTFQAAKDNYAMDVVGVLTKYYSTADDSTGQSVADKYGVCIISGDYIGKLNQCMKFVDAVFKHTVAKIQKTSIDNPNMMSLSPLITEFDQVKIHTKVERIPYKMSVCGYEMVVYPNVSELRCPMCGESKQLKGMVFEDTQFYNQEGQRSKHGCYDPTRHCKFWVLRVQAKEKTEIPKSCIEAVTRCIIRDQNTDKRKLRCLHIRLYLKETKFTEFNDHVPLIRKIITGISPPQLTNKELRILFNFFDKSVNAFERIKPADKSNTPYYPYIIYKILDNILKNGRRKNMILECIHLQSRDTLITNDNMWSRICYIVHGLVYKPTDRNEHVICV